MILKHLHIKSQFGSVYVFSLATGDIKHAMEFNVIEIDLTFTQLSRFPFVNSKNS